MKSAAFSYHAPTTVDEVLRLLTEQPDARLLAGGQSLVPRMNLRVEKPATIIDINRVAGLDGVTIEAGAVTVGALVRQQTLIEYDGVAVAHPLLREAGGYAGFRATRHRGTVGGSIAFAAPWAELSATTVALDATITIRSATGQREVAARSFFVGPYETVLTAAELITEVHFPAAAARTGFGFHEVSPRYRDYATAAAAAAVTLAADGTCATAELVLLRVSATPCHVTLTSILAGRHVDDDALVEVVSALSGIDPPSDIEASGTHRKRLAGTLARRAITTAYARAQEVVA